MKLGKGVPIVLAVALLSGCMNNNTGMDTKNLKQHNAGPVRVQSEHQAPARNNKNSIRMQMDQAGQAGGTNNQSTRNYNEGNHQVPIKKINNSSYVSLKGLIDATGYYGEWLEDNKFGMGDTDPMWTFTTGESKVLIDGNPLTMPSAAIKEGNEMYIPVAGMKKLFGDATLFSIESNNISFFPKPAQDNLEADDKSLDFAEDTELPALAITASSNYSSARLINYARNYLGVKYDFGALPYSRSRRFDCSTFTQHVFKRYGVSLPRLSRQQATKGRYVPRNKLLRGDLMYFYVPGRFKTNRTVGHVGIYMGFGKMIHSSPKPRNGVQITPINKPYWKNTFLYARRVK